MDKSLIKKELKEIKGIIKRVYNSRKKKYFFRYSINLIHEHYLKRLKSTKIAYPRDIFIELTNQCNIACTTCPREHYFGDKMNKGMMKKDLPKKIIDEVYPFVDSIMLTGLGETFMYKELNKVVDYIKFKNNEIKILVSTNAVLPKFIEKVTPVIGKIDSIQISIDGLGKVYDLIRLKSDFKLLDKNILELTKLCKGTTTKLQFNMVVTEENYFQMPKMVEYADKVGIDFVIFNTFNLVSAPHIPKSYYKLYQSEGFLKVVSELDRASLNSKHVGVVKSLFKSKNNFQSCPFPWSHIQINYDGYVPPCCAKPFSKEKNFGNIVDKKVIKIFNTNEFREWRKLWFQNKTPSFCNKCHFVDLEPHENQLN